MKHYMTKVDIRKLKEEYHYRNTTLRNEIAKEKRIAAEFGDRSENAEYKAAKERYYKNNKRLSYLSRMINSAIVIVGTGNNTTGTLRKLEVRFIEDREVQNVEVVTTLNADPENWKISADSPLGRGLLKAKVGDSISVKSPNGVYHVEILKELG